MEIINLLILAFALACLTVTVLNSTPYQELLRLIKLQDGKFVNCAQCTGFWVGMIVLPWIDPNPLHILGFSGVISLTAEFIDRKYNQY